MSTSLYDITIGQQTELTRILAGAGLDADMVKRIIRNPDLAKKMIGEIRQTIPTNTDLFASAEDILTRFRERAELRGWPITAKPGGHLARNMPRFPTDSLAALCLKIWLGSAEKTAEELWAWVVDSHPNSWQYGGLKFDPEYFELLDPSRYGDEPSVEWEVIDLGAYWEPESGRTVLEVREQAAARSDVLADFEVLTVAALHPNYIQAQDGESVPYLDVAGVKTTLPGGEPCAPYISWNQYRRGVGLLMSTVDYRNDEWAAPVILQGS
ncbi:hypothetical protein EPO04_03710 [Patescibacteria group bacterium]|nr:MAG: hypothetical protein EPO04_03710 [Patescibacteria group bacterium]